MADESSAVMAATITPLETTATNSIPPSRKKRTMIKKKVGSKHRGGHNENTTTSSIESMGLILSLSVFILYFIAFIANMYSLPEIPMKVNWIQRIGRNLNMATVEQLPPLSSSDGNDNQQQHNNIRGVGGAGGGNGGTDGSDSSNNSGILITKWPVSIRDEDKNDQDLIIHPGDQKTKMYVPKFWSMPVHDNKLMTREQAMTIGSCATPDPKTGSYARGDDCPTSDRTIYVGIASYRDFECRSTVESIFNRAKYPGRVRVAIVDQIVNGEDPICNEPIKPCDEDPNQALCKWANQVDVYEMKAQLSIGPVFARHIGYRLYRGEYYATQSDAHVTYTTNWDTDIIEQMEQTGNEMAVLSTYLTDVQGSIDAKTGKSLRNTRPIMCNTVYEGGPQGLHLRHASQPERIPSIHGISELQPWWAAGYSFSRGHFVVNVPYDWNMPMIFQGEEMSIGIRGFTIGYDFYAPERSVCFHHYAVGNNARKRNKVHHFWENGNSYQGTGKAAMTRLLGIVKMNPEIPLDKWDHTDEDIYGIGGVRTPEKFYETFGIDVHKKRLERHLCRFVETGRMHKKFTPFLRDDGMGINYDKIDYRFVDPAPNEK